MLTNALSVENGILVIIIYKKMEGIDKIYLKSKKEFIQFYEWSEMFDDFCIKETNDSIKESNNSVVKEREKTSEENSTQIIEVVKYVQSPNGAAKCVDDNLVQQYNKSLPN